MAQTTGGIGRHVASLVPELTRRGADVQILGPETTRRFVPDANRTFRAVKIPTDILKLHGLMKSRDLVHAHGLKAGLVAGVALRFRGRPLLLSTMHNRHRSTFFNRLLLRLSDRVVYVSRDLFESVPGASDRGGLVIPATANVVPIEDDLHAALELGKAPRVVAVGRLHTQKGFDVLIKASSLVSLDGLRIFIVGEGPERNRLERSIAKEGQGSRIVLLGDRADARALIAAGDVFCMPSRWEGSPLALHEAMAAGKPIVATRVGGIADMTGEDAALLVSPEDPKALAGALQTLLTDRDVAQRLGDAAKRRAAEWPDADATAVRIADLYESMLGRPLSGIR
ncbi:MAG: glycosyltransferase family 4 protein [Actinomycetota bacterium]